MVRRQVAQIIASIASIEIPRQEWGELITSLCQNSQNSDINIRMTSLTTLGYICDELRPEDFSNELKNLIVQALVQNITENPEMLEPTKLAVRSLNGSIPFAKNNFQVPAERDVIMSKIIIGCQIPNEDI
jgi:importin subunit beta-1